ncbi:hypothetical protein A2U01_0074697, partial [Trifolium medium]|nr:hypothetical protein [Trifolium medium]
MSAMVSRRWRVHPRGASPQRVSCASIFATWGVSRRTLVSPRARTPFISSP